MNLKISKEQAIAALHCLARTNSRNNILSGCKKGALDLSEEVENKLAELIDKPSTTTNEQPKEIHRNIHMDTKPNKEGLHLWITVNYSDDSQTSTSIHLDRKQARKLYEEINRRLF